VGLVDLRTWVLDDHRSVLERLERGVLGLVPTERWREHVDGGGSSIAWLLLHVAYHQDLAVALCADAPVLLEERRDQLGLGGSAPVVGVGETEVAGVADAVDLAGVEDYLRAVHARTAGWLEATGTDGYDAVPDASGFLARRAGITEVDASWLHAMWSGRPVGWFVQWECVGHGHTHVGEMVSVRNRMGLSPF
jgi:hypothetical protein